MIYSDIEKMNKIISPNDDSNLSHFHEVGGEHKVCDISNQVGDINLKTSVPTVGGKDMVNQSYEVVNHFESENPRIIDPSKYSSFDELCNAIKYHWVRRLRNEEETIVNRLRRARSISQHSIYPVDFLHLTADQAIAFLDYRELEEKASPVAIKNDWKVIKTFTRAYGIDASTWNYRPPRTPQAKIKIIPLPNTVYSLIHQRYSSDSYINALFQYVMLFSFIIGMRIPSEIINMKVGDIFLDDGYIIIRELKKYGQPRQVFPEPELMTWATRKSFKNWIDIWRPKVENQYSKDYLFLKPNGEPWDKNYFRVKLGKLGRQVWPSYHPYISRSWCAIARLIKSKIEKDIFDVYEVEQWLGHDRIKTTEGYIQFAHRYYKIAPFDWIQSILKFDKNLRCFVEGDNGRNPKEAEIRALLNENPPGDVNIPRQIRHSFLLLKKSKESDFWPLTVFQVHSLNPFFYFLVYSFQRKTADCSAVLFDTFRYLRLWVSDSFLKVSVCCSAEVSCLQSIKAGRLGGATNNMVEGRCCV